MEKIEEIKEKIKKNPQGWEEVIFAPTLFDRFLRPCYNHTDFCG
jgi:hypothetical protein